MALDFAQNSWIDERNSIGAPSDYSRISPPSNYYSGDNSRVSPPANYYSNAFDGQRNSARISAQPSSSSQYKLRNDGSIFCDKKMIMFDIGKGEQVSVLKDARYTPEGYVDVLIEDIQDLPTLNDDIGWISGSSLCNPSIECQMGTTVLRSSTWHGKVSTPINNTFRFRAEESDISIRIKHSTPIGAFFGSSELVGVVMIRKEDWTNILEPAHARHNVLVSGEPDQRISFLRTADLGQPVLAGGGTQTTVGICVRFGGGEIQPSAPVIDTAGLLSELDNRRLELRAARDDAERRSRQAIDLNYRLHGDLQAEKERLKEETGAIDEKLKKALECKRELDLREKALRDSPPMPLPPQAEPEQPEPVLVEVAGPRRAVAVSAMPIPIPAAKAAAAYEQPPAVVPAPPGELEWGREALAARDRVDELARRGMGADWESDRFRLE
jgi:hypothetical protein